MASSERATTLLYSILIGRSPYFPKGKNIFKGFRDIFPAKNIFFEIKPY
jgi:hypothetical protein